MNVPFRVGATSYVMPAGLAANAAFLRGQVDDIELVLFDTPAASNIPTREEVVRLAEIAGDTLTFSLHLPTHLRLTTADQTARHRDVEYALQLLDRCAQLPLSAIIVHLEGDDPNSMSGRTWEGWRAAACSSLGALRHTTDVPLCIENIERYRLDHAAPAVASLDLHFCLDVGHEWKAGRSPADLLHRYLRRARVLHLHAVGPERDHAALTYAPAEALHAIVDLLCRQEWDGIVTLEVYEDDFAPSLARLKDVCRHWE